MPVSAAGLGARLRPFAEEQPQRGVELPAGFVAGEDVVHVPKPVERGAVEAVVIRLGDGGDECVVRVGAVADPGEAGREGRGGGLAPGGALEVNQFGNAAEAAAVVQAPG